MFGHSSTIRALDWSQDGRVLRSSSADYEIMYWSPRGKVPPPPGLHANIPAWVFCVSWCDLTLSSGDKKLVVAANQRDTPW